MKKAMILCICILLLTACTALRNSAGNDNQNTATDSAITGGSITASAVSGSAVSTAAVSGAAMEEQEGRESKEEKQKVVIVTDETGKKRELKLGDVDTEAAGVYFADTEWVTNYSQVIDGHYYYLRYEGTKDGDYIIYQDKGEKVGEFDLDEDYAPEGFIKYGENYFIWLYDYEAEDDDKKEFLAYINLQKKKVDIICYVGNAYFMRDGNVVFCNIYKDAFYYDRRSMWDMGFGRPGDSVKYEFASNNSQTENIPMSLNAAKGSPYWTYMDGKIYYGVADGKKVTLFSYDLESGEEREIFYYERKQKYKMDVKYKTDVVYLEIDKDYIYCQDYLIPRSGGKMVRALKDANTENGMKHYDSDAKYRAKYYTYNKKYIFYIDKDDKVHRISKATKEDIIISNLKAIGVDCTEDSVYVKVHAKAWYGKSMWEEFDDDDEGLVSYDDYSNHLYCMDLDGKNVKRIWEGGY